MLPCFLAPHPVGARCSVSLFGGCGGVEVVLLRRALCGVLLCSEQTDKPLDHADRAWVRL